MSIPGKDVRPNSDVTCPRAADDGAADLLRKRPPPKFAPELSILFRPDVIAHRKEFGHWEGDLVLFRQKYGPANVTTMIERTSRFLEVLKNEDKRAKPIMAQIARALMPLPRHACRSVTFDRGSEFVDWPHVQAEVGAQTWFCEAQSPWQKGAVENANKRLRRWLGRDTDPNSLSQEDLRLLCAGLNATPRKCLGFRTPAEVFKANLLGRGHRRAKLSRQPKSHLG
ncbi:IS30 family transposase [Paracoccus aestuariivivens]|nr:IS30 family transposase [Paracoccus aestuariivivens]